jgi:hypothetical protein
MDTSNFDLTGYRFIQLDVSDVTEAVNVRIIFENASNDEQGIVGLQVTTTGLHSIKIPQIVDVASVQRIFVGSLVERSERFALTAVWLAVPEPAASQILAGVIFIGLLPLRRHGQTSRNPCRCRGKGIRKGIAEESGTSILKCNRDEEPVRLCV